MQQQFTGIKKEIEQADRWRVLNSEENGIVRLY